MNTEKVTSKVCTKCKEEKALEEFNRDKNKKYGRSSYCRACVNSYNKKYYKNNYNKIKKKVKLYRENNIEKVKDTNKAWRDANPGKMRAYKKVYVETNPDKVKASKKKYADANRDKKKEYYQRNKKNIATNQRKKYREDPVFRTIVSLRRQTSRLGNYKSESTIKIVGCSPQEFWKRNGSPSVEQLQDLHIDHIVPLSWFDLSNEDHVAVSSHHSNLQYLNSEDNLAKGSSYAGSPDNIIAYKDDFDIEAYVTEMIALINIL